MRRRQAVRPGKALRTSTAEVTRTAARRRRRRDHQAIARTSGIASQSQQGPRPVEGHQTIRPVRRTVRIAPAASRAIANAVNAPASGSASLWVVSRRLIVSTIPSSSAASDAGWYEPPVVLAMAVRVSSSSAVSIW